MLSKFSVRRPFTVLVCVILAIILGVVSFMNTKTDLLPSINLPYAIVFTTYVGATPEEVESQVTIPVEQRMATLSGLKSVTSTSNEYISLVILEFEQSVSMDSASLEMREHLDLLSLPSGAGKPTIVKINPNMLPVAVLSASMDGAGLDEISSLVSRDVAPSFESIPGVASASLSGLIRNELHVVLYKEKIDAVNQKIADAIQKAADAAMAEAQARARAAIAEQAAKYAADRTAELIASGMTQTDAAARVQSELPSVTEQITRSVTEQMQKETEGAAQSGGGQESLSSLLTTDTVTNILAAQNFSMPAGYVTEDGVQYMVRVGDRFSEAEQVKNLLLARIPLEGVGDVRLGDVADVFATDNSHTQYTRVNGNPAVMISMQKQTEYATSDVAHEVLARAGELEKDFPGLHLTVLMNQGEYIDVVISSVLQNLLIGALLAILILLIFLRDLRPTFVIALSIPISLMVAFSLMYFTGISLNVISMSGLALGVGMLVDNSIVVIENIYRMRNDGMPARRAAVEGARQVAGAIAASTLTTISVFLPIVFTQGITRQLFTDLGLTISYSLLASLIIALTLVPSLSSGVFRNMREKDHRIYDRMKNVYGKALSWALGKKWLVMLVTVVLLAASAWGVSLKGSEFIPSMNSAQLSLSVEMPEGAAFDDAVEMAETIGARISDIDDIETVGVMVGSSQLGMMGSMVGITAGGAGSSAAPGTGINMYVLLKDGRKRTNDQIAQEIRDRTADLPCDLTVRGSNMDISMMSGSGISVVVTGSELDTLAGIARDVAALIAEVPGAAEIDDGIGKSSPEIRVRVDKDEAAKNGLTVAQVLGAVASFIKEPSGSVDMTLGGRDYVVVVQDGDWTAPDLDKIKNLELTGSDGLKAKLSDVAEVYSGAGMSSIRRANQSRQVTVSGEIKSGYNVGLVNADIQKKLDSYDVPDGYSVSVGGQSSTIGAAFDDLWLMMVLALAFIFLIMVAQFQSLLSPFIVMFTIPLAFTGGFIALLIADMPLSVVAMIGLILLTGVVVNNGIVFIDFVNRLRREGMDKRDALIEAGKTRLRPILMTALTTIVAMSTLTIGMGSGTEMVQPMAVTTVGGLIYATFMTLFIVPVIYDIFHRKNKKLADPDAPDGLEE